MNSFVFALNATAPIILMVALGYFLKIIGLIGKELAKGMNTLVFKVFLPVMLFLNVYKIKSLSEIDLTYMIYAIAFILLVFAVMIPIVIFTVKNKAQRGVVLQAAFRSNFTLIGVSLAESLFGAEGAIVASLLAAFAVPLFNVLAVISLSIFGESEKPGIKNILLGIVKNPLIDGIAIGLILLGVRAFFVSQNIDFRLTDIEPLYKILNQLSNVATPLALIVLGAQFEISEIPSMKKEIIIGVLLRNLIVPAVGLTAACLIGKFSGAHFAAFVALLATPVAVSTVPMAQEMGADSALAGQLVIWTTAASAFTIFICSFILKEMGIFI